MLTALYSGKIFVASQPTTPLTLAQKYLYPFNIWLLCAMWMYINGTNSRVNCAVVTAFYPLQLGLALIWTKHPGEHTDFTFLLGGLVYSLLAHVLKLRPLACWCLSICLCQAALERC